MINKRGQLALWVVIAIVIFAIFAFVLFFARNVIVPQENFENPENFIESCISDAVKEAEETMLPQGGFIEPENYKIYRNIKIVYLCENIGYFRPCINQHPVILSESENEMIEFLNPRIELCFQTFKAEA